MHGSQHEKGVVGDHQGPCMTRMTMVDQQCPCMVPNRTGGTTGKWQGPHMVVCRFRGTTGDHQGSCPVSVGPEGSQNVSRICAEVGMAGVVKPL